MSTAQIVVLTGICSAFVVFAAVLAWGEHLTRNIGRDRGRKPQAAPGAKSPSLKIVAAEANMPAGVSQTEMACPII